MTITPEELQFQKWVASALGRRKRSYFAAALGCFVGALAVLWLTWLALRFTVWFTLLSLEPSSTVVLAITGAAFAGLFAAYFLANRPRPEDAKAEAPTKMRVNKAAAILGDSPFLPLLGPPQAATFVRVVAVVLLVGPALLATSWKLLQMARAAGRASPEKVADVLRMMAAAGVRVSLEELIRLDQSDAMPATFAAVRLFDGVVLRTSEPVGLVLSDAFRSEIHKQLPPEKRQPAAARPAPVRVSSPRPPATVKPPVPVKPPLQSKPALQPKPTTTPKPPEQAKTPAAKPPAARPPEVKPPKPKPRPQSPG